MHHKRIYGPRVGIAGHREAFAAVRRDPGPSPMSLSTVGVESLAAELDVIGISAEVTVRNRTIGSHFTGRRIVLGIDSEALAKRLRIGVEELAEIEESRRLPTREILRLASEALETSPSRFFGSEIKAGVRRPSEAVEVAAQSERTAARPAGLRGTGSPVTPRAERSFHRKGTNMFKIAEYMRETYGVVVKIDGKELGANIRSVKVSKHVDTNKLAESIGLNPPQIYIIESGLNPPSLERFLQIADKLDTHPSKFFEQTSS